MTARGREGSADGGRNDAGTRFEHLASEATDEHVAVVGRHDLGSAHPDVPAYLLEITRIELGADRLARPASDGEHGSQSMIVGQFLAD
ncbi:hypothetical protein BRD01_07895 [Halobacteriales archaeon QS_8_65_32]|nr:MAG: hypothetical protein BRD01_07895 [Halobacteriales archaeon QS_8_65_32]